MKQRHQFQHEYKDYLVIWDAKKLLYRITMKKQAGKVPVKMQNLFFNKPQEAFNEIDAYLRHRPAPRKAKAKASVAKEA